MEEILRDLLFNFYHILGIPKDQIVELLSLFLQYDVESQQILLHNLINNIIKYLSNL